MRMLKTAIAGILALFVASAAGAQTFPSVPGNSVIGRLSSDTGPSQAIPFASLTAKLGGMFGPTSTTDQAIPRWDGTSGHLLQNSTATIDDTGALGVTQDFTNTTGRIVVGTGGSNNSFYPAFVDDRMITLTGTSMHAFADNKIIDAPGDFGMNSFDSRFNVIGTQTYDHIQSFQAFAQFGSTGSIRALTGYTFTPVLSAGGHILTLTGVSVGNPTGNTGNSIPYVGTIDVAYGIFIADYSAAGTFSRAIQTAGPAISEFGGEVRSRLEFNVGCNSPCTPLIRFSNIDKTTTFGSIIHDGTDMTTTNNIGAILFTTNGAGSGGSFRIGAGFVDVEGGTSGRVRLQPPSVAGTSQLTLPAITDTLLGQTSPTIRTFLTVSNNAGTPGVGAFSNAMTRVISADGFPARMTVESYSNVASGGAATAFSTVNLRRSNGSAAVPSAVQSGDLIAGMLGTGFGASNFIDTAGAGMLVWASQTYTNSAAGAELAFMATVNGSTSSAEALRILNTGQIKFSGAANFSANAAVATVLGSLGATGSHTTVQKWLTVTDNTGATLYIPAF